MDADVSLRTAEPRDLPDLLRLTRAFYDEDGFTTGDAELRLNFAVLLAASDAHVAVAVAEQHLCGFALTTCRMVLESGLVAELQDLYTEPAHRRRGIASALVGDAERWASDSGAALLEVVVAPNGRDVTHLVGFYRGRGFRDEGRRLLSLPL